MRFPFTHHIERGDEEIELVVVYETTPYWPATHEQPAEGGDVEIISVKCDGEPFTLYPHEETALQAECEERAPYDVADEAAEAAEWHAQSRRDALMEGF